MVLKSCKLTLFIRSSLFNSVIYKLLFTLLTSLAPMMIFSLLLCYHVVSMVVIIPGSLFGKTTSSSGIGRRLLNKVPFHSSIVMLNIIFLTTRLILSIKEQTFYLTLMTLQILFPYFYVMLPLEIVFMALGQLFS